MTRRVLITGASSGIGEATAKAFAAAGFNLVLVARSADKLAALANALSDSDLSALDLSAPDLSAPDIEALSVPMDLANLPEVKGQIMQAIARVGPIDVLVNCAGMAYTGSLGNMPLADWQRVMDLNVTSVFQVVQAVLPGMRQQADGLIINVASIAAQQSFKNWGAYGVSKAALAALSSAISAEESANGIRVCTLSPGSVDTPIWDTDTVQADFDRADMLSPHTVAQTILQIAQLPPSAVISSLTLTPSQGAL